MINEYPIHLERRYSRSSKAKIQLDNREYNELVERIEKYVNKLIKDGKRGTVSYASIEQELCIFPGFLGNECMIDGGHSGFTINPDLKI